MPNAVLDALLSERVHVIESVDQLCARATEEDRDLVDAELELVTRSRDRVTALDAQIAPLTQIEELRQTAGASRAVMVRSQTPTSAVQTPGGAVDVYPTFARWARDELARRFDHIATLVPGGRAGAEDRLQRAVANTLTGDVPGLLPPQHLAQILQVISTARPFVEASRRVPLTSGQLTYPFVTSRPTVGVQAAEKTETVSTKMAVTMQTVPAVTYLGAGDLSWQTIQWSTPDALQLWFDLCAEAYAQATEGAVAASIGSIASATVVASDDLAGWYGAIAEAAGAVFARTKAVADTIYSDVATGFRLAGLVSNTTPSFATAGQINLSTAQGNIGGLRLAVSPMAAAGVVVVGSSRYLLCAETPGAPVELRAVEPSIGGMEVGIIGAFADRIVDAGAFQKLTPPAGTQTARAGK